MKTDGFVKLVTSLTNGQAFRHCSTPAGATKLSGQLLPTPDLRFYTASCILLSSSIVLSFTVVFIQL